MASTGIPTVPRARALSRIDLERVGLPVVGGLACVAVTLALTVGKVAGSGMSALATAAFVVIIVWCITRRRVDQTLVLFALYLGLLDGYIKLSTGSSTVTLARDVLLLAIAAGALLRASLSGRRPTLPPLGALVIAFCAVVAVQLLNPNARNLAGGLAGVRQHLEFVPLFFLGFAFLRRESQIRACLLLIATCAAIGGVVSLVQSSLTPQELASWGPGYSDRVLGTGAFSNAGRTAVSGGIDSVRPFGLGSDAGAGAVIAAIALPSLIALFMAGPNRYRLLTIPMAVGIGMALATSGSRNALAVAFVSLIAFAVLAANSRNALRAVVGVAIGFVVIYGAFQQLSSTNAAAERTKSIVSSNTLTTYKEERGASLALIGEYIADYPLGAGIGRNGPAGGAFSSAGPIERRNAETEWNFLVLELGVLGLAIYALLNLCVGSWAVRRIRSLKGGTERLYLAALSAPLAGLIAQGFVGPTSASVPTGPYFWLVAGILSFWLTRSTIVDRVAGSSRSARAS